ncbi:MAG: hypothetical protein JXA10_07765 [Anaerolineae bacterium]|nr:hypothetical protein [Anaerolineae bacterium]
MFKNKKVALLLVLLLIVPMVLVACGDDDDGDDKKVELNQTLESASGLTVKYPEGWATMDEGIGVSIANSEEALNADDITGDMAAVMLMASSLADLGMSAREAFDMFGSGAASEVGENGEASDVKDVKVAGVDGYRIDVTDDKTEGFIVGFEKDGNMIIGIGVAAKDKLGDFEATLLAIIESATYTAPAAE